jgi:UPF0042 nucleotide-binding protein
LDASCNVGSEAMNGEAGPPEGRRLQVTIITGLSGAGKSTAMATFEDAGYFCVDNMPPQMLSKMAELFMLPGSRVEKVALVFDSRGGAYFEHLEEALADLQRWQIPCRILFLEAAEAALVARYQSTRRCHPLAPEGGIPEGIRREKELLSSIRDQADVVIDTTGLNLHQLRRRIQESLLAGELENQLLLSFLSFGFKYGIPTEADMVLDVRFLPNPYWQEDLKHLSGLDEPVSRYVLGRRGCREFMARACGLIRFLTPLFLAENKTQLVVALGCTGGRHRSVTIAEELADALRKDASVVTGVCHRDIHKGGMDGYDAGSR